jgi:ribosomal protein L44E
VSEHVILLERSHGSRPGLERRRYVCPVCKREVTIEVSDEFRRDPAHMAAAQREVRRAMEAAGCPASAEPIRDETPIAYRGPR